MSNTAAQIRTLVTARTLELFEDSRWMSRFPTDSVPLDEVLSVGRRLLEQGKRTRASLAMAAYMCASDQPIAPAIEAGAALELYQASALVHDDVIDHALTRRNQPAAHVAFRDLHTSSSFRGDAEDFGVSAAILLGDLFLSLAHEAMRDAGATAFEEFTRMTSEVAFGQYLDMRAEHAPTSPHPVDDALSVLTHKSARYSVVCPLLIGARMANAPSKVLEHLEAIGIPLGEAFQLRDDDLGVFGDPVVTGKPVCGDITEGKRTVLLALILESLSTSERERAETLVGTPLSPDDATWLQHAAIESGARDRHEQMILDREEAAGRAREELRASGVAREEGLALLDQIVESLTGRTS